MLMSLIFMPFLFVCWCILFWVSFVWMVLGWVIFCVVSEDADMDQMAEALGGGSFQGVSLSLVWVVFGFALGDERLKTGKAPAVFLIEKMKH